LKEAARAARLAIIKNLDQESREKLKKQEVQVYRRKNPKQPTNDQSKSPEVLPLKTSKVDNITLDFDLEAALSKMHVNVPLKEALRSLLLKNASITSFRERLSLWTPRLCYKLTTSGSSTVKIHLSS
jgi:hypothetical protein